MLHSSESLTWGNKSVWIWKMIVDETEEVQQSINICRQITASKFQGQHVVVNICRYEGLFPGTKNRNTMEYAKF